MPDLWASSLAQVVHELHSAHCVHCVAHATAVVTSSAHTATAEEVTAIACFLNHTS